MEISSEILAYLVSATEEVFETMVFQAIRPLPAISGGQARPPLNVVASVPFAGHRRGLVAFHSSQATARRIAGSMLGLPGDSFSVEIPDAIGEVANMIAGTFRNKLAEVEPASSISVPLVTVGSDFSTYCGSHVRRMFCPFTLEGQPIYVELVLTSE
jgi:chemotaxis protein CheX